MTVEWRPAWQRAQLSTLRGRSNDSLTELERQGRIRPCVARLLRHALDAVAGVEGVIWLGAAELADRMGLTERRVRQLLAEARGEWLQRIHFSPGGRHRTSRYALKFGAWRDDPADPHMQAHFAERSRAGNAAAESWLQQLFADHLDLGYACCTVFAPRDLKNPEIAWST